MQFSQGFIEDVLILLLTAGIGGFLFPYLLKLIDERRARQQREIDDRRNREQKRFEAYLARQNKIIEAQVQLLENLSKQLWDFLLLALAVSYFKYHDDEERHQKAFLTYEAETWLLFGSLRTEISRARRLTSPDMHAQLLELYQKHLITMDSRLIELVKNNASGETWSDIHQGLFNDVVRETDDVLNRLADVLKLSVSESKQIE